MIHLIQLKTMTALVLIPLALVSFGLLPQGHAVSPPPDGGYPGGNTAEGQAALLTLTTGSYNTAVGFLSLRSDATGQFNTAIGAGTLFANTADENTATGAGALLSNTTGNHNTANGAFALFKNTTGTNNTAHGRRALFENTIGIANVAVGNTALQSETTGHHNTAIGNFALPNNLTGSFNVALGATAGGNVTAADNVICIGTSVNGENVSERCYIGNIRGVTVGNGDGINVIIDSDGQLGTGNSSRRFKRDIKPIDQTSAAIMALKPVTFHYRNQDTKGADDTPHFGLIAEDVAEVNPDLVVRDDVGEPLAVRYDAVNAMLLNEFLKEHRRVQKLEATVAGLIATMKEQAAEIQKVSARIEMNKPAPQIVQSR